MTINFFSLEDDDDTFSHERIVVSYVSLFLSLSLSLSDREFTRSTGNAGNYTTWEDGRGKRASLSLCDLCLNLSLISATGVSCVRILIKTIR